MSFNFSRLGYVLVVGWSLLGAIAAAYLPYSQFLERETQVGFLGIRGTVPPPSNIVIVAIDERALEDGKFYDPLSRAFLEPVKFFPWQRTAYARAIDRILAAGAKVVSLDILLLNKSSYGEADDIQLQKILDRYGDRVVLASNFEYTNTPEATIQQLATPEAVFKIDPAAVGFVNFRLEQNGKIHRLGSEFIKSDDAPNLGLAGENKISGQDVDLSQETGSFDEITLLNAKVNYTKPKGTNIYFFGSQNTWLASGQQISFTYILDPENWRKPLLNNGKYFKDKVVLIGATAPTLQDIQPTAFGRMSGVEVHANAIATLLTNRAIVEWIPHPLHQGFFLFLVVGSMGLVLILIRRPVIQFAVSIGIAIAWITVSYICFVSGIIIPTALPAISIVLIGLFLLALGQITAQIEKKKLESEKMALEIEKALIRSTFKRYVAAPVVDEIINQLESFRTLLQGRTIKAAVLFADIRNFTKIAAHLPPQKLIQQLNTYLTAMVGAILESQGTVDKFIGDAVMAEFGSPISYGAKIDIMNAIRAALAMRSSLYSLRQQWQDQGEIPLFNGIGINYGEVIVGNIGSPERLEYAVIGDAVNIASRVEGLTKNLKSDILITETVYEIVYEEVDVLDLGEQEIRGCDRPLRIYSLIGLKGQDSSLYSDVKLELAAYLDKS